MNMTKMKVNIFLDDIRETPAGFIRTYTVDETIKELEENNGNVGILSLDNDLGLGLPEGYFVLDWIEEQVMTNPNFIMPDMIKIHSKNIVAKIPRERILDITHTTNNFVKSLVTKKNTWEDIKADMALQGLKGKEYIHSIGKWNEYLEYLKTELSKQTRN